MQRIFIALTLFCITGCEQTRSFLHMNSNSPAPFLGLELSVDRGTPLAAPANADTARGDRFLPVSTRSSGGWYARRDGRKPDSERSSDVVSLPAERLSGKAVKAAKVDKILARLALR